MSLTNIQESALQELQNIVLRQSELAAQAATFVSSARQREALATEADSLTDELNRIIRTTSFNGTKLLDGSQTSFLIQSGLTSAGGIGFTLPPLSSAQSESTGGEFLGDGTFASNVSFSTRSGAGQVESADFNNDGMSDFVVGAGAYLITFLNNGDGSFRATTTQWTDNSLSVTDLVTGDFNNDGKADYAAALTDDYYGNTLVVYLGNGNGTFSPGANINAGGTSAVMKSDDLDGDSKLDIVLTSPMGTEVFVFYGQGNGTFQTDTITVTGGPSDTAIADFDGDGKKDIAVNSQNEGIRVYRGLGSRTFAAPATYLAPDRPYSMIAADLNGDGRADLLTSNISSSSSVYLNNGDGTFKAEINFPIWTGSPTAGDFNGDGSIDYVAGSGNKLLINLNDGTGTFSTTSTLTTSLSFSGKTATDLDGDGVLDILATSGSYINIFYGNKSGVEGSATTQIESSALEYINLRTSAEAKAALSSLSTTRSTLSRSMGAVGAIQSRLNGALQIAQVTGANFASAASRIGDADVAQESAELLKGRILQESAAAVLAQANMQAQIALRVIAG